MPMLHPHLWVNIWSCKLLVTIVVKGARRTEAPRSSWGLGARPKMRCSPNRSDTVEATAIKTVFSDHATSGALAFSSTKGAVGHLLGAAGAVEAIFSVLSIHHGVAPLTLNLSKPDPIFNSNFMPLTTSKEMPISSVLSNSFGFGGTNASLLFTRC